MSNTLKIEDQYANEHYTHNQSKAVSQNIAERKAETQAAFFLPHLRSGMTLLDCGCGPGSITVGLAEIVAPGQVVGIDVDDKQIEQAQTLATSQGVKNVRFERGDIYTLHFADNSFDAVFSNTVLHHLNDPLAALEEINRVLKPGGIIGVREPDFDGILISPADPKLLRFWELFAQVIKVNGGNPHLGRQLRALLRQARFVQVSASASYEPYGSQEAVRHLGSFVANALREGNYVAQFSKLVEHPEEVDKMREAWEAWAENTDAFFADVRCDAVGWKAS